MRKLLLLFAVGVVVGALLPRDGKRKAGPTVDEDAGGTNKPKEFQVPSPDASP
jgi:hypothetical protein